MDFQGRPHHLFFVNENKVKHTVHLTGCAVVNMLKYVYPKKKNPCVKKVWTACMCLET